MLAIGGLDPGGGAGILADVRAAQIAKVYACACVTVLTVQSTAGLVRTVAVDANVLASSVREVMSNQRVNAIKIGALGSDAQVRAVAAILAKHREIPVVVDTPRKPSRGRASLNNPAGFAALVATVLPLSTILTVNADEAAFILGRKVHTPTEAELAARELLGRGPRCVVVKGGHLEGDATDIVATGDRVIRLVDERADVGPLHGTGCTFASLIAARLAAGRVAVDDDRSHLRAIRWAKSQMARLIRAPLDVGGPARVLA